MSDDSGANAALVVAFQANLDQLRRSFERASTMADGALRNIEARGKQTQQRLQENIELIRLTQQLDVARAAGNTKVAEKLGEEIALRKTINSLIAQGVKAEEARGMAETHVAALAAAKKSREGFGGAGLSIIDRARFGLIEEGGAKIGIFGSALEKIGPYGVAAGAAIAAFALSLEQAEKAMEWSEDLEHLATRLGLTTTELQELQFAALKTGVSQETLAEGVQKVSQAVGAYTSNVKDARVKSVFEALGISKDDARAFEGPVDGMEKIADALAKVKDHSQQLALAKDLKVPDEMVPLLLQGGDKLREMAEEAHALGVVMDGETVKKMAELAEKTKVAKSVVDNQLRVAFLNLAPAILACVTVMARLATLAADVAESMHAFDWMSGKTDYSQFNSQHLQREADSQAGTMDRVLRTAKQNGYSTSFAENGDVTVRERSGAINQVLTKQFNDARAALTAVAQVQTKKGAEERTAGSIPPATALASEKSKAAPQDRTADFDTAAAEALDAARKASAQAYAALASTIEDKAQAERAALTSDTAEKLVRLDKQANDIKAAKVDSDKQNQLALLDKAKAEVQNAAQAKLELINRNLLVDQIKAIADLADQEAQYRADGLKLQSDHLTAMAAQANTLAERNRLDRAALDASQAADAALADAKVKLTLALLAEATISGDPTKVAAANVNYLSALQARQGVATKTSDQNAAFGASHQSPWEAWASDGKKAAADVGTTLQTEAVKSMDAFNDGLAQSIVQGKSLGATMKSVFASMEVDLIKYLAKLAEIGLFGDGTKGSGAISFIGSAIGSFLHFADGGPVPGSGSGDTVPAMLTPGEFVLSHNMLRGLSNLKPMQANSGVAVVNQHFSLQAPGALMFSEFVDGLNQQIAQTGVIAAQQGAKAGHQMTMSRLQQQRRQALS